MSCFSVEQLSFCFPDGRPLFEKLDWDLKPGEIFCLLGPGGEGKSVFLRLLVGLLQPVAGVVRYQDQDLREQTRWQRRDFYRQIGFAFQRNGLFDSLTCADNLRFPLTELQGLAGEPLEQRVREALADVRLVGHEDKRPSEMSGGMQKRLGIARALALKPKVVLYDEPTAGLDPLTSAQIHTLILQARDKYGMSAVVSTTDPVQAFRLADRIGFLHRGRFTALGNRQALQQSTDPAVRQFLSGSADGPLTEAIA